jgi:hypothetical protein
MYEHLPIWTYLKDWASFDFESHDVGHQERLTIDGDVVF